MSVLRLLASSCFFPWPRTPRHATLGLDIFQDLVRGYRLQGVVSGSDAISSLIPHLEKNVVVGEGQRRGPWLLQVPGLRPFVLAFCQEGRRTSVPLRGSGTETSRRALRTHPLFAPAWGSVRCQWVCLPSHSVPLPSQQSPVSLAYKQDRMTGHFMLWNLNSCHRLPENTVLRN